MNSFLDRLAPGWAAKVNLLVDLAVLLGALTVSVVMTGQEAFRVLPAAAWFAAAAIVTWIVSSTALRHYSPWPERKAPDDAAMVCVLLLAVAVPLAVVSALWPTSGLPSVGWFLVLCTPTVLGSRLAIFRRFIARSRPPEEVLVVGTGALGRATGEFVEKNGMRRHVLGYLSLPDEDRWRGRASAHYLGMSDRLAACLARYPIVEVYLAGNPVRHADAIQEAIRTCERFGVPFALPAYTFRLERSRPACEEILRDGYVHYSSIVSKPYQMALKRLIDIAASGVALAVLFPFLLTVAAFIKLTSRGAVIYRQVRVGLHGKTFNLLKFRSMVANADALRASLAARNEQAGPVFKIRNDPRITRFGRFMRRYSIDELPQLVNVLRGDMSLVGPRPPLPSEVQKYEPWQRRRLSVRPGLTCHWQVSGRNQISFERWMYLDMRYIDHWSLGEDVALIFKTVPVVVSGRGAS